MKERKLWLFALAGALVITGVVVAYTIYFWGHKPGGPAEWAMFGDFVGGLANPLLGFLTIFLLIVSLFYQSQELAATRKELAQSKEAMQQANQLHDNNLLLQSRNNLRLQLDAHFQKTVTDFNKAAKKEISVLVDGCRIDACLLQIVAVRGGNMGLFSDQINKVIQDRADWSERGWNNIAVYIRPLFLRMAEAFVALIEYSDSELITDVAENEFDAARNLIEESGIYAEWDLEKISTNIQKAIKQREQMTYPAYHKKTKVY